MSLQSLVKISNKYGSQTDFVIAGGGNTSVKEGSFMYVKASGNSLGTITAEGFAAMEIGKVISMLNLDIVTEEENLKTLMEARVLGETKRPSVETLLHASFVQKYVVHLHPALVNGMTCALEGEKHFKELFSNKGIWIEEIRPGFTLGVRAKKELDNFKRKKGFDCQLLFLQNHGVFFAAETVQAIEELIEEVIRTLKRVVSTSPDFQEVTKFGKQKEDVKSVLKEIFTSSEIEASFPEVVEKYLEDITKFIPISSVYTPDHMVYAGIAPMYSEKIENISKDIKTYEKKYNQKPKIVCVKDAGVFSIASDDKNAKIAMLLFYDAIKIAEYSSFLGGHQFMSDSLIDFIANWEAEVYRKKQV